jgi:two-component SAPR family response regulator
MPILPCIFHIPGSLGVLSPNSEILLDSDYDLVIPDIKMPVLNGFELCENIIEIDKTMHITFITAQRCIMRT